MARRPPAPGLDPEIEHDRHEHQRHHDERRRRAERPVARGGELVLYQVADHHLLWRRPAGRT